MRMRIIPDRDDGKWRVHSLAVVDGAKVTLTTRPVHLDPLTTEAEGGITSEEDRAEGAGVLMRTAAVGAALLALLSACGPVTREAAEAECFERARLATQPRGEVYVGTSVGPGGGPYVGGKVAVSSDFIQGRDPSALYDSCVFQTAPGSRRRSRFTHAPDWKG